MTDDTIGKLLARAIAKELQPQIAAELKELRASAAAEVPPDDDRFLRMPEVIQKVGLSRQDIWKLQRQDRFPKSFKLTAKAVGFRLRDIQAWMDSRPAA